MDEFRAFVALANRRPEKLMAKFGDQERAWRQVFEALEQEILLARGRRTEPLIRLLRDHWPWRWLEVASVYDAQLTGPAASPLAWQSHFSNGLLASSFVPDERAPFSVLVGPYRNAEHAEQSYACLTQMVDMFYEAISRHRGPLYSRDRLSQFFSSRSALSDRDIVRLNEAIAYVLGVLATFGPESRMDLADLQSTIIFGHALAGVRADASASSGGETGSISVAVNYNLLRGGEGPSDRSVVFEGSIIPLSGVTRKESIRANNAPAMPGVRSGASHPQFAGPPAIKRALARELSKSALAVQSASALQGLEELLLLRYKLSDNFGVLTAYGTAAPQSPLQGTGDEDADRAVDKKFGRRIARGVAEVTGANIGVIYRYNYVENHLDAVGLHTEIESGRRIQLSDYEWMVKAGHDEIARRASVAYNAADLNHPASFGTLIPAGGLTNEMMTQAAPPEASAVPPGGTILAVPIRVFGRVWGVVEVVSTRPGWFDTRALEMLQRVADLVGPYYHEHLLMKMLYNIADVPPDSEPERAFVALAEALREMTLSDGACVWLSDSINSDEFSLSGCSGREDLEGPEGTDRPKITKDSKNSVALDVISEHKTWFAQEIGKPPLDAEWLRKPHTRTLQPAGFKYLALLPVYGEDFARKAVISLYSRESPYSESWQSWGTFIANYIGVVLNRVYNVEAKERSGRRLIAHEVINAVKIARGSSDKVFAWAKSLPKEDVHAELYNWKSDISTYLDLIQNLSSGWADAEAENVPAGAVLVNALRNTVANKPEVTLSLREEFNSSLQPLSADMRSKQLSVNLILPEGDASVKMHREALKMILSNLSANAVKYSNLGAPIQFRLKQVKFGVRMDLRNLGPELAPGEEDRIFDMEFRGTRTQGAVPGKGLGLYIAKQVCDVYGITLSYDSQPAQQAGEVWHRFSLEIPSGRVDFWGHA